LSGGIVPEKIHSLINIGDLAMALLLVAACGLFPSFTARLAGGFQKYKCSFDESGKISGVG
jgi:hypothetical protein